MISKALEAKFWSVIPSSLMVFNASVFPGVKLGLVGESCGGSKGTGVEKFGIVVVPPVFAGGVAMVDTPVAKAKAAANWSWVIPGPLELEGWEVLKHRHIVDSYCDEPFIQRFNM